MIRRKFDLIVTAVCLTLLGYFGWHAFYGPRGFAHRDGLVRHQKELQAELDALLTGRGKLEKRVSLMRPDSIDPDLLDELARANLDYGRPTDLVIQIPK